MATDVQCSRSKDEEDDKETTSTEEQDSVVNVTELPSFTTIIPSRSPVETNNQQQQQQQLQHNYLQQQFLISMQQQDQHQQQRQEEQQFYNYANSTYFYQPQQQIISQTITSRYQINASSSSSSQQKQQQQQHKQQQHVVSRPKRSITNVVKGGRIELIIGPMFCGKTTELIRRMRLHCISGKNCVTIKHVIDTRYSQNSVVTHDKTFFSITSLRLNNLQNLSLISSYDIIGIDEGHFFLDLNEFVERASRLGKWIIIAALNCDWRRQPFSSVTQIIGNADNITKLSSVCAFCKSDFASFTAKIDPYDFALYENGTNFQVGGVETYAPACRYCHILRMGSAKM